MSIMQSIGKPADQPIIATILGDAGTGKTSLAATFPNPIFIRAEDGLQAIPADSRPDAFPVVGSVEMLWEQLTGLINEEHEYKTAVVDSVTALERLFIQHVIDSDPKKPKSINQANGGYGAGLAAVSTLHQRVRRAAGVLRDRGINVIFIAHADFETVDLPDTDPYSRYSLRLGKKSIAPYVDDVDFVGMIKLVTFTTGDGERKKAISDGSREIVCTATPSAVTKNRYGIVEPIPVVLGQNPLQGVVPCL